MNTTSRNADTQRPRLKGRALAALQSSGLRISLWLRWFVVIAWLAQLHLHIHPSHPAYLTHFLSGALLLGANIWILYRFETRRGVSWRWTLALSSMDIAMLTGGLTIAMGSGDGYFVLYYASLAMFATVCISMRVTLAVTTVVAAVHATLHLAGESGPLEFRAEYRDQAGIGGLDGAQRPAG